MPLVVRNRRFLPRGLSWIPIQPGASSWATLELLSACLLADSLTPDLLAQAHTHAQSAHASGTKSYRFFSAEQAADFDAFSAQILPTDDTPGAREANVVHFTDYLLSTIDSDQRAPVKEAFVALHEQVAKTVPARSRSRRFLPRSRSR